MCSIKLMLSFHCWLATEISVPSSEASMKIIQKLLQLMHRCSHHVNIAIITKREAVSVLSARLLEQFCKLCKHALAVPISLAPLFRKLRLQTSQVSPLTLKTYRNHLTGSLYGFVHTGDRFTNQNLFSTP